MTLRTVLIAVLAVVFGIAAAVYATNAITSKNHEVAAPEKVGVVVTIKPVSRGVTLAADMLDVKQIAKEYAPADAVHGVEDAVGRVAAYDLVKDDQVLESKLARKGVTSGLAPLLREGMQASTILTPTAATGVGGFIRPGDRVDVLLTVDHFNPEDRGGTVRLMQAVEVLAVDNRMESTPPSVEGKVVDHRDLRFVTLQVEPEQAQVLADGQKRGILTLALRNPQNTAQLPTKVVTPDDLKYPPIPKPPDEKKTEVVPAATRVERTDAPIKAFRGGIESSVSP